MNIRFTSSLTPEDENRIAPAVLKALSAILDLLPIAYTLRIETTDSTFHQSDGAEPRRDLVRPTSPSVPGGMRHTTLGTSIRR